MFIIHECTKTTSERIYGSTDIGAAAVSNFCTVFMQKRPMVYFFGELAFECCAPARGSRQNLFYEDSHRISLKRIGTFVLMNTSYSLPLQKVGA